MQKLGEILLFILNVLINVFIVGLLFFFLLWLIFDITPERTALWVEYQWDALWGRETQERSLQLSPKYQQRAHRNLYIQEANKKDEAQEGPVTQPYKYE